MTPADFQNLLHRYQQGICTPEEKRAVEQWYDSLESEQPLDLTPTDQDLLKATLWQRITAETAAPAVAKAGRWAGSRYAAAAALVLGLGIARLASGPDAARPGPVTQAATTAGQSARWKVVANTSGKAMTFTLADGSVVSLAPASSLKYPAQFRGEARRTVYLSGEAFFKVFHNPQQPFLVYTNKLVTKVLGTSFTVRAFESQKEAVVLVKTGRVRVTPRSAAVAATGKSIVVLPNQQAVYRADRHQLTQDLVAKPALLVPQSFVFDDQPVAEVVAVLEKAYGVPIVYDKAAFAHCTVTLRLSDEPLYDKLDILCKILGTSYEKEHTRILLHNGKC
jgi:transmembrane sensor